MLTERLTFERTGVRLYDRVLERIRATGDPDVAKLHAPMTVHRDQEKEHEEWLEAKIRELGGSAHAMTAKANLVKTESRGLEEVIFDERATLTADAARAAGGGAGRQRRAGICWSRWPTRRTTTT